VPLTSGLRFGIRALPRRWAVRASSDLFLRVFWGAGAGLLMGGRLPGRLAACRANPDPAPDQSFQIFALSGLASPPLFLAEDGEPELRVRGPLVPLFLTAGWLLIIGLAVL